MAEAGEREMAAENAQSVSGGAIEDFFASFHRGLWVGVKDDAPVGVLERERVMMNAIHDVQQLVLAGGKEECDMARCVTGCVNDLESAEKFFPCLYLVELYR